MSINGTNDRKIEYAILYPSKQFNMSQVADKDITMNPIERITRSEEISQNDNHSINEAKIGFTSMEGAYVGSFSIFLSSKNLSFINEIRAKNLYFDCRIQKLEEEDGVSEEDYMVIETLLIGCKITKLEETIVYGGKKIRTYGFKYCKVQEKTLEDKTTGKNYTATIGPGKWTVTSVIGQGGAAAPTDSALVTNPT